MNEEEKLREKYGTDTGYRVPEGYFEALNRNIIEGLPAYPKQRQAQKMSAWQRVKPYVYLAAMFAGIWVMMKVFHTVGSTQSITLDNPPAAVISLLDDNDAYPVYMMSSDEPEYILEDEVSESYDNIDDFEKDFGYQLKPEYASIKV